MGKKASSKDFDVQIAHSVEEIDQDAWGRLTGDQPFSSYQWYRFCERAFSDDTFIYVLLSLKEELVACSSLLLTGSDPEMAVDFNRLLYAMLKAMLRRWPLLIGASPFSSLSGTASGIFLPDPPLRDVALEVIAQTGQELAQQYQVSFLAFPWLEKHEAEYPGWPDDFMATELPNPTTFLEIKWTDFDSYLAHLSRKRRKHYRQHLKYAAQMGIEVSLNRTVTEIDEAMALIRNTAKKYQESPPPSVRRMLENAVMVDAVWLTARVEGRLVGCELMLGDKGVWQVVALGRDYDFPWTYFLLGYEDIRFAIEHGAQILEWAPLSYKVKQRLGFQLGTNNYAVFMGNGPLFYRLGRWIGKMYESKVTDPYEAPED